MKSTPLLVLIGFVGLVAITQATDYCNKTLCGSAKHIGCNNSGNFASTCPPDKKLVDMNSDLINSIVSKHNECRNSLANGKVAGLQPCPRMASMQWHPELAALACLNVKTCKFAHDACRNTDMFRQSGQNIAQTWSSMPFSTSTKDTIIPLIDAWWSEKQNITMKEINSYPEYPKAVIGHAGVMCREQNNFVGCCAVTFRDPNLNNWYSLLYACNYATTNIINSVVYSSGTTATKCKTGVNPNFKGLCSIAEKYP